MARKWWTLIAVCIATFMLLLDITIVNVALPAIQRSLDASFSDLQWVVDAYALALATFVLTAGSLADLFGRKRIFLIGVALFTLASAACGAANDPLFLIIARGAQGIGGAMMFATAWRSSHRSSTGGSAARLSAPGARRSARPSRSARSPAAC